MKGYRRQEYKYFAFVVSQKVRRAEHPQEKSATPKRDIIEAEKHSSTSSNPVVY
jgi:hypothetical protein